MAHRGDWLKADPAKAREMGRKGGRMSGQIRLANGRSADYIRGYRSGFMQGKRERLTESREAKAS